MSNEMIQNRKLISSQGSKMTQIIWIRDKQVRPNILPSVILERKIETDNVDSFLV